MKKHFVTFLSPGTFVSETTTKEISSWSLEKAVQMADEIVERYGATPYAFYFTRRERGEEDLDSRVAETSPLYYLGGTIESFDEVVKRNDPKEEILRWNMKSNGWTHLITNNNSWLSRQPFNPEKDVRLEYTPPSKREKT
jgi:hypothetical protein